MRFDIVTIGSGTVDVFVTPASRELRKHESHLDVCYHVGDKVLIKDLTVDTGGGGTNSAVAFSRLGFRTGWLGVLGNDHNAQLVRAVLKKEKVRVLGRMTKGRTGYSVIMVKLRRDRAILAYKGVNNQLRALPQFRARWLYCSAMMGASWDSLVRAIKRAKQQGTKCAFNPSLYLAKKGLRRLKPVIDDCDLFILNKEEAVALTGKNALDIKGMLALLQQHAKLVVITDGPRGAHATNGIEYFRALSRKIKVVETTGAGDGFASGVVAGLMLRNDLAFALKAGLAQSESVIRHVGAKNNLLSRAALLRAVRNHRVVRGRL